MEIDGRRYVGESEVKTLMSESHNYSVLLRAWAGWRRATGPPSKSLFKNLVTIGNQGARAGGTYKAFFFYQFYVIFSQ